MNITDEQRGDMLHALGLNEHRPIPQRRHRGSGGRIYRNHYNVDDDSASGRSWEDLITKGFATKLASPSCVGSHMYFVTLAGVEFLGAKHMIVPNSDVKIPTA